MPGPIKVSRGSAASFKRTLVADTVRGVPRLRTWPGPQSQKTKEKTAAQREWFRQAQWAAKFVGGGQQYMARVLTDGTPLMPRDILTMAMAGRFLEIRFPDGRRLLPVSFKSDVSRSLDALSSEPGTILVRGPDLWQALLPGPLGTFLRSYGPDETPKWGVGTDGGYMGGAWTGSVYNGNSGTKLWNAPSFDDFSVWSSSNRSRFTVPAGATRCRVTASLGASGSPRLIILKNGSNFMVHEHASTGSYNYIFAATGIVPTAEGDYWEVYSSNPTNTYSPANSFGIEFYGAPSFA